MTTKGGSSAVSVVLAGALLVPVAAHAQGVSFDEVLKLPYRIADVRVAYGTGPQQFGELWLPPRGRRPHPVAVVVHGGCWRAAYGLDHIRPVCEALAKAGMAAWCLEYRRVGDPGGGWPGTFEDVARGTDHLRQLAAPHGLDLARVVAMGHSAGGHLALWLAARPELAAGDSLRRKDPVPLRGVVGLAPIGDLAKAAADGVCGDSVAALMGGAPAAQAARYRVASPAAMLPLRVPQHVVHGRGDRIVPLALSEHYAATARAKGDTVQLVAVDGAGHFDVIAPPSKAWAAVEQAVRTLLAP